LPACLRASTPLELLLNSPFQKLGLRSVSADLSMGQFSVGINPNITATKGRLFGWNVNGMQNRIFGNLYIIAQLRIKVESDMFVFRRGPQVSLQQQSIWRVIGILNYLVNEAR
jgi:hypothetical protein